MPRKPTFSDEEPTPPPQEMPQLPSMGRTPTPSDLSNQMRMLHAHQSELTRAIGTLWDARKDGERLDRLEQKIDSYLLTAARNDTKINDVVWPHSLETMRKLDLCLLQLQLVVQVSAKIKEVESDIVDLRDAVNEVKIVHDDRIDELDRDLRDTQTKRQMNSDRLQVITQEHEGIRLRVAILEQTTVGDKRELQVVARQDRRRLRIIKWIVGAVVSIGSGVIGYLSK